MLSERASIGASLTLLLASIGVFATAIVIRRVSNRCGVRTPRRTHLDVVPERQRRE